MEFEKLKNIIAEQFNIKSENITESTNFITDLNADSLDLFQLITALEEEFGVEFPNEEAESIKTVGDASNCLKKLLS